MLVSEPDPNPPTPDPLHDELVQLGSEQADKLLGVIRGLFQCIGDLNARIAELERRLGE